MTNQIKSFDAIDHQTIVALCSPQGSGAIALIRLSGDNALSVVDAFAKTASGKKIVDYVTHSIVYGWVVDQNQTVIDQVLFFIMHAPKTFTGQAIVEITCHNNPFLIEQIIDRAIACGARLAGNGEFSQRAVMSGKIDLLQAEAINDLIHAQSAQALKCSMAQLQGSFSSWIATIEQQVLDILAFCEGSFEFLDEEMEFGSDIAKKLQILINQIEDLLRTYPKQQQIKDGIKIALIGSVNVGKSSLFNALIKKNRAIVTPIAGTTRDCIETSIFIDGEFFTFIDTAGIRETNDVIEQEGIDRSFNQAAHADIILLVMDQSKDHQQDADAYQRIIQQYDDKIIHVLNKIDLPQNQNEYQNTCILVSAHQPETVQRLLHIIKKKADTLKKESNIAYLLNKRQYDLLANFLKHITMIQPMLQKKRIDYELISYHLQQALQLLSEMTGRSINQAAFDKVFQTFCVGK
ncbi:tRNA uridine-5-carboxymethylaminomethyl(34) synthesis GTPase MnmE [Candidatus Babeliales bacterium]|nr:tRNA uridine-5-carboxymethylaminomethyl(34) synthesis GTPase MnmE [Candidatus Babeliales bacterium]